MSVNRAMISLEGLSVGDAFGEMFFSHSPDSRTLPEGPWRWTDDTHMAISIVDVLRKYGRIEQDFLAKAFAERFMEEPTRGYAGGAKRLLLQIAAGGDWRELAPGIFPGGSYGNGAAMRAAPIGGFFGGDPFHAADQARLSAVITHAHPEGQAGAMAVAAAASMVSTEHPPSGHILLEKVLEYVPPGETRRRIEAALFINEEDFTGAVRRLGTGYYVSAQDTVPFCLWVAAHCTNDFTEAMWRTVKGLGDRDTTCAIVGGIVALSSTVPAEWVRLREPLPEEFSP